MSCTTRCLPTFPASSYANLSPSHWALVTLASWCSLDKLCSHLCFWVSARAVPWNSFPPLLPLAPGPKVSPCSSFTSQHPLFTLSGEPCLTSDKIKFLTASHSALNLSVSVSIAVVIIWLCMLFESVFPALGWRVHWGQVCSHTVADLGQHLPSSQP